MLMIKYQGKSN